MYTSRRWRRIKRSHGKSRATQLKGEGPEEHIRDHTRCALLRRNCQNDRDRYLLGTEWCLLVYHPMVRSLSIRLLQHANLHRAHIIWRFPTVSNTRVLFPNGKRQKTTKKEEKWNLCWPRSIQGGQAASKDVGRERRWTWSRITRARER